jgi:hypothetical protein
MVVVSVASVVEPSITPPTKVPALPVISVSVETEAAVDWLVALVLVVASVVAVVVDVAASSSVPVRLSDTVGGEVVGVDDEEQPGLLTETHASAVSETSPTGVSCSADTAVVTSADTGTGAVTSSVSVAVVSVRVVVRSV